MKAQRGVLPTLTEVVETPIDVPTGAGTDVPAPLPPESLPLDAQAATAATAASARYVAEAGAALTMQVLEALRPRVDALLEAQLREALAPLLTRLADSAVQSARAELSMAMHALVAQTVKEVLAQRRKP